MNQFYSVISSPNKEEIAERLKKARRIRNDITWNKECNVKVEHLNMEDLKTSEGTIFTPALMLFLKELKISQLKQWSSIGIEEAWRNTYTKGAHQEIHDHSGNETTLSAVLFLEDHYPESAKFYFYNRHCSEIPQSWRDICVNNNWSSINYALTPKAYDIIFFPSYMLHGVTPHRSNKPRTTISLNMRFVR